MDDAELVRQVLQGNLGAYVDLLRRYTAQIAALCRAHIHRRDVVEDLVEIMAAGPASADDNELHGQPDVASA